MHRFRVTGLAVAALFAATVLSPAPARAAVWWIIPVVIAAVVVGAVVVAPAIAKANQPKPAPAKMKALR